MGKTQLGKVRCWSYWKGGKKFRSNCGLSGGVEGVKLAPNLYVDLCFYTYLESSLGPDNALNTENALAGSCRTGAVAK